MFNFIINLTEGNSNYGAKEFYNISFTAIPTRYKDFSLYIPAVRGFKERIANSTIYNGGMGLKVYNKSFTYNGRMGLKVYNKSLSFNLNNNFGEYNKIYGVSTNKVGGKKNAFNTIFQTLLDPIEDHEKVYKIALEVGNRAFLMSKLNNKKSNVLRNTALLSNLSTHDFNLLLSTHYNIVRMLEKAIRESTKLESLQKSYLLKEDGYLGKYLNTYKYIQEYLFVYPEFY